MYYIQGEYNSEEIVKYLTRRIIERVLLALHKKDKFNVVLHLLKQVYEDLMPDKVNMFHDYIFFYLMLHMLKTINILNEFQLWQIFIGNDFLSDDGIDAKEVKKMHPWVPDECLKKVAQLKVSETISNYDWRF